MNFLRYIQGFRKGKEAHRLEKEAMQDPFLADALEGYSRLQSDPLPHIDELRKQVARRSRKRTFPIRKWSIAAGILLVIGFGSWWTLHRFQSADPYDLALQEIETEIKTFQEIPPAIAEAKPLPKMEQEAEEKSEEIKEETQKVMRFTPPRIVKDEEVRETTAEALTLAETAVEEMQMEVQGVESGVDIADLAITDQSEKKIRGIVTDKSGSQLNGAVVRTDDMKSATLTDSGGRFELYVKRSMIRPKDENGNAINGEVKLSFRVSKEGRPYDIKVVKPLHRLADTEAVRLLQQGPDWPVSKELVYETIVF